MAKDLFTEKYGPIVRASSNTQQNSDIKVDIDHEKNKYSEKTQKDHLDDFNFDNDSGNDKKIIDDFDDFDEDNNNDEIEEPITEIIEDDEYDEEYIAPLSKKGSNQDKVGKTIKLKFQICTS
jgi:hypothetical protein